MTRRRTRTAATAMATAVAALLLAGCAPRVTWMAPTNGARGSATPNPSGSVNAPNWSDCSNEVHDVLRGEGAGSARLPADIVFQCATVAVPQDWHNPQAGQTFDLALIRLHSTKQHDRIGSLVINPGGPGGSGIELAVNLSGALCGFGSGSGGCAFPDDVLERFDVIGFDPRGVGRSDPVKCFTDADLDGEFGWDPDPVSQADFDGYVALNRKMAQECQTKYGAQLSLFSTEQAARDIDAIRRAVGDPKLSYLGFSYGTLLGATYAQLFPTNIRAMVLDGAVDPTATEVAAAEGQAKGFTLAFNEFSSWCTKNSTVCPVAADPTGAVNTAMAKARTAPLTGKGGRKVTSGWVLTGVFSALYSQREWPLLGLALSNINKGDPTQILLLADDYANRDDSGHYGNMFDIFNTVSCDDDGSGDTVDQARSLQSQWRAKYPLFGTSLAMGIVPCATWTAKRDPFPTGKAVGAPPIVVVGTTNDPATPYEQTAKLATMLGVGHVVTWQGEGHTAYPQTTCIRAAIDAYLIGLSVPQDGLTCPP